MTVNSIVGVEGLKTQIGRFYSSSTHKLVQSLPAEAKLQSVVLTMKVFPIYTDIIGRNEIYNGGVNASKGAPLPLTLKGQTEYMKNELFQLAEEKWHQAINPAIQQLAKSIKDQAGEEKKIYAVAIEAELIFKRIIETGIEDIKYSTSNAIPHPQSYSCLVVKL